MRTWRPLVFLFFCGIVVMSLLLFSLQAINASAHTQTSALVSAAQTGKLHLDSHLPVQSINSINSANNVNAKFGSRFDFVISPTLRQVSSGTDGVYHDNTASYIVGVVPTGSHTSSIFHMGTADPAQGDTYVHNEQLIQGLDTSRWQGDASDGSALHITVDIIDTFLASRAVLLFPIALTRCAQIQCQYSWSASRCKMAGAKSLRANFSLAAIAFYLPAMPVFNIRRRLAQPSTYSLTVRRLMPPVARFSWQGRRHNGAVIHQSVTAQDWHGPTILGPRKARPAIC